MKKILFMSLFLVVILVGCKANGSVKEEPISDGPRIIATTVALTNTAAKLNIDLVGVPTTAKDLPEQYKDVKQIGQAKKPNMEIVNALQPTDLLSVTTIKPEMKRQRRGVKSKLHTMIIIRLVVCRMPSQR